MRRSLMVASSKAQGTVLCVVVISFVFSQKTMVLHKMISEIFGLFPDAQNRPLCSHQSLPCVKGGGSPKGETEGLSEKAPYLFFFCGKYKLFVPQPLRAKSKILPTSPYTGEALVRCVNDRSLLGGRQGMRCVF